MWSWPRSILLPHIANVFFINGVSSVFTSARCQSSITNVPQLFPITALYGFPGWRAGKITSSPLFPQWCFPCTAGPSLLQWLAYGVTLHLLFLSAGFRSYVLYAIYFAIGVRFFPNEVFPGTRLPLVRPLPRFFPGQDWALADKLFQFACPLTD